ncbi:hypothetical protein AGMMS4952_24270 [Spirochaetia bacterium]|nr:hypothetical protein AGMMS4952_24270 [Spirochaetia bacterium]
MKKFFGLLALAIMLSSCASLQEMFNSIGNSFGSAGSSGGNTGSQSSPLSRSSKAYVIPASYETAYSYRTDTPDPKMKNIPKNIEANRVNDPAEYVRQIAAYINENSRNDFERVKKAHDLVAVLVRYDAANFWANTVPDQSYQNVLKTKLAVCQGYSELFKKLCDELKVPCDIVIGFGRGVGTSPFAGDTPTNSNHAWNIVTINNENYLIDCTWDSGYMDGKVSKQSYTTDWLFLKPEQFLCSHYPENQKQQLMAKSLSSNEFLKLPFYKPKFFEVVEHIDQDLFAINQVDGKLVLDYTVKDGFDIIYSIFNENGSRQFPNNVFSQQEGGKYKAYFSFPAGGKYLLRIFWKKVGAKTGESCGELGIISTTGNTVQYPTQFSSSGKNIEIISPIEMPLQHGKTCAFKVRVDNKKVIAVIYGKNFVQLTKGEDGVFSGELEIPAGIKELSIGIADSEKGRYEYIVRYQVN